MLAFQTGRIANQTQNPAVFDNVNLRQARVRINGEQYPKYPFQTNFGRNEYTQMYQCMDEFKKEFYGYNSLIGGTQISYKDFNSLFPIVVLDVRRQSEVVKHGNADIEVNLDFDRAVPADTHMYIIMLSDSLYQLTSDGSRMTLERK